MLSWTLWTAALFLIRESNARVVLDTAGELQGHNVQRGSGNVAFGWLKRLIQRDPARICIEDEYYDFVHDTSFGKEFCQIFMHYPNTTVTVDYTPISTTTDIFTTKVVTHTSVVRFTPRTTETVTVTKGKQDGQEPSITLAPRRVTPLQVKHVFKMFQKQHADLASETEDDDGEAALSASFSSACACQTYGGSTITETYTDEARVVTRSGFELTSTTRIITRTAGTITEYTTVFAEKSSTTSTTSLQGNSSTSSSLSTSSQSSAKSSESTKSSRKTGSKSDESSTCTDSSTPTSSSQPSIPPQSSDPRSGSITWSFSLNSTQVGPSGSAPVPSSSRFVPTGSGSSSGTTTTSGTSFPFSSSQADRSGQSGSSTQMTTSSISVTFPTMPANKTSFTVTPLNSTRPIPIGTSVSSGASLPSSGLPARSMNSTSSPIRHTSTTSAPTTPSTLVSPSVGFPSRALNSTSSFAERTSSVAPSSISSGFPIPSSGLPSGPWNSTLPYPTGSGSIGTGSGLPSYSGSGQSRIPGTGSSSFSLSVKTIIPTGSYSSVRLTTAPASCPSAVRTTVVHTTTVYHAFTTTSYGCFSTCPCEPSVTRIPPPYYHPTTQDE